MKVFNQEMAAHQKSASHSLFVSMQFVWKSNIHTVIKIIDIGLLYFNCNVSVIRSQSDVIGRRSLPHSPLDSY